ncbi:MAG: NADH-quinone oxidoreductase subunit K [Deltaproteobacteria bacterium RBG_16_42_7]|nr:MAG: NADH-quinone oxidoreductase subunit K [Deltaproteobacteria bacterium RBG_16_42_7]
MIPLSWYIMLSTALFIIGIAGVLMRRNILVILMSIELILNAANINLVAFSYFLQDLRGQVFAIFVMTVAAAEAAVGLGILVALMRNRAAANVNEITTLKG